jgi:hypothetical protein
LDHAVQQLKIKIQRGINMKESITYELMKFNNHVKENFDWLDFQVTLLDFTRMNIIVSDDPSYYFNYEINLYGVKYLSGNLTWTIDIDEDTCVVKIIDEIDSNILPSLRENCFYLRFNNTDLDTPSFIIMAENIVISYEKNILTSCSLHETSSFYARCE